MEEYVKERIQEPLFCRQCDYPECYWACPKRDRALCIDEVTGARYINAGECVGCKSCIGACPLTPPRISFDPLKKVSLKCDLCKDRLGGPACVEVCPSVGAGKALTFVGREERK
ncbi:MAG: 4Fe-4S dicluster domain-containing protein [Nitrososphaeria archaeon]